MFIYNKTDFKFLGCSKNRRFIEFSNIFMDWLKIEAVNKKYLHIVVFLVHILQILLKLLQLN